MATTAGNERVIHSSMYQEYTLVEVLQGDVTTFEVDAIVNAANSRLRGGGGIDGEIHKAAGKGLLAELTKSYPKGGKTGEAFPTGSHNIKSTKHIIHAVGPDYRSIPKVKGKGASAKNEAKFDDLLSSCYTRSFAEAMKLKATSIAFPAISTGIFKFPADRAALIALDVIRRFVEDTPWSRIRHIVILLYGAGTPDEAAYNEAWENTEFGFEWINQNDDAGASESDVSAQESSSADIPIEAEREDIGNGDDGAQDAGETDENEGEGEDVGEEVEDVGEGGAAEGADEAADGGEDETGGNPDEGADEGTDKEAKDEAAKGEAEDEEEEQPESGAKRPRSEDGSDSGSSMISIKRIKKEPVEDAESSAGGEGTIDDLPDYVDSDEESMAAAAEPEEVLASESEASKPTSEDSQPQDENEQEYDEEETEAEDASESAEGDMEASSSSIVPDASTEPASPVKENTPPPLEPVQCEGITKAGARCKVMVGAGKGTRCFRHRE